MAASKRPDRKEEQEGDIAVGLQTVARPQGKDVMSGHLRGTQTASPATSTPRAAALAATQRTADPAESAVLHTQRRFTMKRIVALGMASLAVLWPLFISSTAQANPCSGFGETRQGQLVAAVPISVPVQIPVAVTGNAPGGKTESGDATSRSKRAGEATSGAATGGAATSGSATTGALTSTTSPNSTATGTQTASQTADCTNTVSGQNAVGVLGDVSHSILQTVGLNYGVMLTGGKVSGLSGNLVNQVNNIGNLAATIADKANRVNQNNNQTFTTLGVTVTH